MPLTVIRREGQDEWAAWLDGAASALVCRAGDEWTLDVEAQPRSHVVVATGPYRSHFRAWTREPAPDAGGKRWRYRRSLDAASEWTTGALDAAVRDLVWHPLEVAPNAIRRMDPGLARALETTVLEALRDQPEEPLIVRFGIWNGEDDGPRYLCKIESLPSAGPEAPACWRWWSPLVRTPVELASALRDAIVSRERPPFDRRATNERQFWGWAAVGQAGA